MPPPPPPNIQITIGDGKKSAENEKRERRRTSFSRGGKGDRPRPVPSVRSRTVVSEQHIEDLGHLASSPLRIDFPFNVFTFCTKKSCQKNIAVHNDEDDTVIRSCSHPPPSNHWVRPAGSAARARPERAGEPGGKREERRSVRRVRGAAAAGRATCLLPPPSLSPSGAVDDRESPFFPSVSVSRILCGLSDGRASKTAVSSDGFHVAPEGPRPKDAGRQQPAGHGLLLYFLL